MTNVIIGGISGFYMYFIRNAIFKGGDPSSDKQQPFNPITSSTGIRLPERIYELIAPVSHLYPQIEVDKNLEPSTVTFKCYFREPFPMLPLFTFKGLPTTWQGASDTIRASFKNRDDVDNNIGVQLRLPDPSGGGNHVDLLFDGGKIINYNWIGEAQGAVMEEIEIKFSEITENTQAIDIEDGHDDGSFDLIDPALDGGWALWNLLLFPDKKRVLLTKDVTITIGGVTPTGLKVQSWKLNISVPNAMEFISSSFVAGIVYEELRGPWSLELSGKLAGKQQISEAISTLATKAKSIAKLRYDASPHEKFFQFTNAILKNIDGLSIPESGKPIDVTYVYEGAGGSLLTYQWTGSEAHDPSDYIEHT